jgi:hypothetical protein
MSGTFDEDSIRRISRAVRRVERMPLNNPTDDGSEFAAIPPPVFGVALVVEEVDDEYSGDAESYYADTCSGRLWRAYSLSRNGCSWDLNDQVYLFELNDTPLIPGRRYTFRAMESHFQPRSNIAETFMLGMVDIPLAGLDDSNASDEYYDYYDGSPDSADPGDVCEDSGESTAGGGITIPFNACDDAGNPCQKELVINSPQPMRWCIRDPNGCGG